MQDKGWNNDFLSKLKSNVNIVNIISRYVPLTKKGRTYWGCCPFHHEKTPSFAVNDLEQFYHCFGCGESGDVITFIQKIEGVDFIQAVKTLAESANMELPEFTGDENIIKRKKERDVLVNICTEAARYYHDELLKPTGKIARDYLVSRQINDETITQMGLGYSPNWQGIIYHLKKLGYNETQIKKAGLLGEKNGRLYDAMAERLVFPIFNHVGKIVGFSGRALSSEAYAKYKNTEETDIFKKSYLLYGINNLRKARIEDKNYAIMVEGQIDVVSLYQAGIKNAIASLGTAFNEHHIEIVSKFVDSIYICFDGDNAGIKATQRSIELLKNTNFDIKVITLPDKMDPDEYIKKYGKDEFENQLKNAKTVKEYEIEILAKKYDLNDKNNISKFVKECLDLIVTFDSVTERDVYLKIVASKANMNEEILRRELNKKILNIQNNNNRSTQKKRTIINKLVQAETYILACKMFKKDYCKEVEDDLFEDEFYISFNKYLNGKNAKVSDVLDDFDVDSNEKIKQIIYFDFNQIKDEKKHYDGCLKQLELRKLLKEQTSLQISLQTASEDEKIIILNKLQKIIKEIQTKKVEE